VEGGSLGGGRRVRRVRRWAASSASLEAIKEKIRLAEQASVGDAKHRYLGGAVQVSQRLAHALEAGKIGWAASAQPFIAQDIRHIQQGVSSVRVVY
jgi:hypothetical protein